MAAGESGAVRELAPRATEKAVPGLASLCVFATHVCIYTARRAFLHDPCCPSGGSQCRRSSRRSHEIRAIDGIGGRLRQDRSTRCHTLGRARTPLPQRQPIERAAIRLGARAHLGTGPARRHVAVPHLLPRHHAARRVGADSATLVRHSAPCATRRSRTPPTPRPWRLNCRGTKRCC